MILSPLIEPVVPKRIPKNMNLGFRTVHPDMRSRNGYRWPHPGEWAHAEGPFLDHRGSCPREVGDGICVAHSLSGASSAGITSSTFLLVAYADADVIGDSEAHKVRVKRALVLDVFTHSAFIGPRADLRGANLRGANLYGADLRGANLRGANLYGADLRGANLHGANLHGADLSVADLSVANLRGANLRGANLYGANLHGADLYGANLHGADLGGANANQHTKLPTGWVVCNGRIERQP